MGVNRGAIRSVARALRADDGDSPDHLAQNIKALSLLELIQVPEVAISKPEVAPLSSMAFPSRHPA
jgi:hypothetical protein